MVEQLTVCSSPADAGRYTPHRGAADITYLRLSVGPSAAQASTGSVGRHMPKRDLVLRLRLRPSQGSYDGAPIIDARRASASSTQAGVHVQRPRCNTVSRKPGRVQLRRLGFRLVHQRASCNSGCQWQAHNPRAGGTIRRRPRRCVCANARARLPDGASKLKLRPLAWHRYPGNPPPPGALHARARTGTHSDNGTRAHARALTDRATATSVGACVCCRWVGGRGGVL
jgi:hypothetical protein